MATIDSYTTSSGQTLYRVRYRTPDRKQTAKRGFRTKRDALAFLHTLEASKTTSTFIDPADSRATIADLGVAWLAGQSHLKPSSLRSIESAWRIHVSPTWGDQSIGAIRHSAVQRWVTDLTGERGPTTVLRAYGVLAGILDMAVKDRRLPTNPARDVNLPRKSGSRRVYLSHQQVSDLAHAAGRYAVIIDMLAYTGLRWGELTALRVRDVDTTRRRLNIRENAVMVGSKVVIGTPKTHAVRSVPYPRFLAPVLEDIITGRPSGDRFIVGDGHDPLRLPNSKNGWFANAVKRAQAAHPGFPYVTPHGMRHTAASLAISAGANVKAVQRMLGHKSAAMTLDVYADLFDDDLDAVSDALDHARSTVNVSTGGSTSTS